MFVTATSTFVISSFLSGIEDINECALNISGCNQNCTNTIGSYFCSCYPGYEIKNDNRTCVGKELTMLCLHVDTDNTRNSSVILIQLILCISFVIFVDIDDCVRNISGCNQSCTNAEKLLYISMEL